MFYCEIGVGKEGIILQFHRKAADGLLKRAEDEKIEHEFFEALQGRLRRPGDLITLEAAYHDVSVEF